MRQGYMKTTYKKPLTAKEQISYLEENKRVVYHDISKEEAESILLQNNYINVITPYKHRFAKKGASGKVIRDKEHRLIYERDVDFKEYADAYFEERKKYTTIYTNIMKFETTMNAIVSNEVIRYYNIVNYEAFEKFLDRLRKNADQLKKYGEYSDSYIDHVVAAIEKYDETMKKYDDIYIFMDRLMLADLIAVFRCCDRDVRSRIFKELLKCDAALKYNTFKSFDEFLKRVTAIRNCICHFNSLEVLANYWDIKNKIPRTVSDKKKYVTIINKLSG